MSDKIIPAIVKTRIIATRAHFHELNGRAKAAQVGATEGPVTFGFATKPLELEQELRFWSIGDDEQLEEFLFEDLLSGLYAQLSDEDWDRLPIGYAPLVAVLEFERHCMFEGWSAVSNKSGVELDYIMSSYKALGLPEEAAALKAVSDVFSFHVGDEDEAFHDSLSHAYRSVTNPYPEMEDRIPVILRHVRSNPDHYWVDAPQA